MTTPTPRERLATAVKALDEAYGDLNKVCADRNESYYALERVMSRVPATLAAARALLAAPDDAEVVRLRERDAAWEWLAINRYEVKRCRDNSALLVAFEPADGGDQRLLACQPDPVALATALDANWRKA